LVFAAAGFVSTRERRRRVMDTRFSNKIREHRGRRRTTIVASTGAYAALSPQPAPTGAQCWHDSNDHAGPPCWEARKGQVWEPPNYRPGLRPTARQRALICQPARSKIPSSKNRGRSHAADWSLVCSGTAKVGGARSTHVRRQGMWHRIAFTFRERTA
jgi:hypothetical protein